MIGRKKNLELFKQLTGKTKLNQKPISADPYKIVGYTASWLPSCKIRRY